MADLKTIRDDLIDEFDVHGSYVSVKQSRDDPRIVVELHEFIVLDRKNVQERVDAVVGKHTDLDAEIVETR